jgi:hypothetical protein
MKVSPLRVIVLLTAVIALAACSRPTAVPQGATDAGPGATLAAAASVPGAAGAPGGITATGGITAATGLTGTVALTDTTGLAGTAGVTGTSAVTGTTGITNALAATPAAPVITEPITAITKTLVAQQPGASYAFDYPAAWTLTAYEGAVAMLTSFPLDEPGHGGIMPGETKLDFTPDLALTRTTLDEMVASTRAQTTVLADDDIALAGGFPARRLRLLGPAGDQMYLLLTIIDGRGLRVFGYGDLALFDPIVRTIRAAK